MQAAQRRNGCPIPEGVQGWFGWSPGQPDLMGGNQSMAGSWNWVGFKVPASPSHPVILAQAQSKKAAVCKRWSVFRQA